MKGKLRIIRAGLLCFVLQMAALAPTYALSLSEVVQAAMIHAPRYQSALEQYNSALELAPTARSQLGWKAGMSLDGRHFYNDNDTEQNSLTTTLRLSKPLFNMPYELGLQKAYLQIEVAQWKFAQAQQVLLQQVAELYFSVAELQEQIRIIDVDIHIINQKLTNAERLLDSKLFTPSDVLEAEAKRDQVLVQKFDLEISLGEYQRKVAAITGFRPQDVAADITQNVLEGLNDIALDEWLERGLQEPSRKIAMLEYDIAKLDYETAQQESYPTLDLTLEANSRYDIASEQTIDNRNVSLTAEWQFASGGYNSSQQRKAAADIRVASANYIEQQQDSINAIINAYANTQADSQRLDSRERAIVSANAQALSAQQGFDLGLITPEDLLSALALESQSKFEYSKAYYQAILNIFALKASVGILAY